MTDDPKNSLNEQPQGLSAQDQYRAQKQLPPAAAVLHETVRLLGEEELNRNLSALWWSALAAGLSMGFSLMTRGLLQAYLPAGGGFYLVECAGYSVGFVIVILARQQLFTENTITAVLPLMSSVSWQKFGCLLRLWLVVMLGNLVGVAIFAYGLGRMALFDPKVLHAFANIGEEVMHNSPSQMFTKGIMAGWLIAMMVWMNAAIRARLMVIILMTYIISIGGFTHIIVGSAEVLFLVFQGHVSVGSYFLDFALPTLAGNIVGGSLIFALISHAQVRGDEQLNVEQEP
ncbi:formate/nitrite transporter family protein [Gallaecimonas mangrovi]|uniref:formate/nitrite transporter family protein n=1 Tax=Gallaecimonas mangrovi TaxID=2291597 RepID=UPI000E2006A9|nr:formate/nitrite transporter family protein [Gallaecimonas mangrovi]